VDRARLAREVLQEDVRAEGLVRVVVPAERADDLGPLVQRELSGSRLVLQPDELEAVRGG
jgi:hypothetical protein